MNNNHKIGDIYLTRNTDEVGNNSPGYWNHAAIYVGSGFVVEAQEEPNSVIIIELDKFRKRYPHFIRLRFSGKENIGVIAANHAHSKIGQPYRKAASIFFRIRKGENCVSVVRDSYKHAFKQDPVWRIPDHILNDARLQVVEEHKDYKSWVKPKEWFEGQTYYGGV